mgnify:FL=1
MENVSLFFGIIKWFFFAIIIIKLVSFLFTGIKMSDERRLNHAKALEIEQKCARDELHRQSVENQIRMEELYIEIAEARLENLRDGESEKAGKEEDALLRELERKIGQKPRD